MRHKPLEDKTTTGNTKFKFVLSLCFVSLTLIGWHWVTLSAYASPTSVSHGSHNFSANNIEKIATIDTYVASGKPEQQRGNADGLWVGYSESGDFKIERTLIQFDVSEISTGSVVDSAKLSLYLGSATSGDGNMPITAQRIISDWNENINWRGYKESVKVDDAPSESTDVGVSKGWYDWDLTALLRKQLEDPNNSGKFSILLTGDETPGQHERGFWSKDCAPADCDSPPGLRPILRVTYQEPTPTPVPTPTPTPGINASLHNKPADSNAPIGVGDTIVYTVRYANNNVADLTDVKIDAPVPDHTEFVPGETIPSLPWTIDKVEKGKAGEISYTVKRKDDSDTNSFIFNKGATISWRYPGGEGEMKTNAVVNHFNPSGHLYLPLINNDSGPQ